MILRGVPRPGWQCRRVQLQCYPSTSQCRLVYVCGGVHERRVGRMQARRVEHVRVYASIEGTALRVAVPSQDWG